MALEESCADLTGLCQSPSSPLCHASVSFCNSHVMSDICIKIDSVLFKFTINVKRFGTVMFY